MAAEEVNAQPEEDPTELASVWHYTTAEGLSSIVTSGVLWATSHRFMNDSEEPKHATKVLRSVEDSFRRELPWEQRMTFDALMSVAERGNLEVFLLCASYKPDLLTVWRGYGDAVPYAIELDARVPLLPVARREGDVHPSPPANREPAPSGVRFRGLTPMGPDPDHLKVVSHGWTRVRYDAADAELRVREIAKMAAGEDDPFKEMFWPSAVLGGIDLMQLKHPAFEDEREARMVFNVTPRWKFVRHRATRFGLTPYIEVSPADGGNLDPSGKFLTRAAARLPIKAVHIGPSPLGAESEDALREFLEFNGYPDTPVVKSETPFR